MQNLTSVNDTALSEDTIASINRTVAAVDPKVSAAVMPRTNSGLANASNDVAAGLLNSLSSEILQNAGTGALQNPETGLINKGENDLSRYSTRLFGAPFQLMDSVDARFPEVNTEVGSEYLRNFLINSPILYIRPGMPKYTGGDSSGVLDTIDEIRAASGSRATGGKAAASVAWSIAKNTTILGNGGKLQKRMFGFRETYLEYMQYVDYMCRTVAILMGIPQMAASGVMPEGTFVASGGGQATFQPFQSIRWKDYRMSGQYVKSAGEMATDLGMSAAKDIGNMIGNIGRSIVGAEKANTSSALDMLRNKVSNVQFMVHPENFTEELTNTTGPSLIESMISGMTDGIGSEIAFMTNSNLDMGLVGDVAEFLGNAAGQIGLNMDRLKTFAVGDGLASNIFSGALGALKGQKMIYPEIYKSSEATMDYSFSVTLSTPYGDPYNYYMNIVVPLMHLIALVAPRMMTSNTIASPFLVQAYIPGMCTCELGIVRNMSITKNPKSNHVSIHGFPLTVEVRFTIHPLYRNISISPAHDPSSFLFNETLNDYLANIAGLVPSVDTYMEQRGSMIENANQYFKNGTYLEEMASKINEKIESMVGLGSAIY